MTAYMYIPGINGTASGSYEKWIEFEGFSVAAGRDLPLVTPGLNGRGLCVAKAGEFMISKAMDASTPLLFQQACSGAAVSQVQLDLCEQTPKGLQPYVQYTLENVIFSQYTVTVVKTRDRVQSREWLALNFTGLEQRYMPSTGAPVAVRHAIASHQPNFADLPPAVWVYRQSTGELTYNGQWIVTGYSGCGDEAKNNSVYQYEHGVNMHIPGHPHICHLGAGPLPVGRYTIGLIGTYGVGPNAMPLIPAKENIMLGRDRFYIHSDNHKHAGYSSDGCIVIEKKKFRLRIGAIVAKGTNNTLQVIP